MFNERQDLEWQKEHDLPGLGSNINHDGDKYETVVTGVIAAQVRHYYDPRLNTADRSEGVRNLIEAHVVLALVHAGLSFTEALFYPAATRVKAAMIAHAYIFEGKGKVAI